MSKRRLIAPCLVLALAAMGVPSVSLAQISPAPHTFTLSGPLVFTAVGNPPVTCNATMTVNVDASGIYGVVSSAAFKAGSLYCHGLFAGGLPWSVARIGPGAISISNIRLETAVGTYCTGTIHVSWVSNPLGTGTADTQGVMPGNFGTPYPAGSCTLDGTLTVSSGGPVSIN